MSVVVRMEMPENCQRCELFVLCTGKYKNEVVRFDGKNIDKKDRRCLFICSLPEGHGRLGDLDAFEKDVSNALVYGLKEIPSEEGKQIFHVLMQEVLGNVKKRKTIVPAEAERSET